MTTLLTYWRPIEGCYGPYAEPKSLHTPVDVDTLEGVSTLNVDTEIEAGGYLAVGEYEAGDPTNLECARQIRDTMMIPCLRTLKPQFVAILQ